MNIVNLAICFYGQYRSGDVCLPHLKSIIDNINVENIDIFCSTKNSLSFHASRRLMEMGVETINDDEVDHIRKTITDVLNPKSIHFVTDPFELITQNENKERTEFNHHGVLSPAGVIDSLLLKQKYEAETGIFYDAVIMLRYDVIFRPMDYIPQLIEKIKSSDDLKVWPNDPDSIISPASNHAYVGNDPGRYTMFCNMINDLLIVFTGAAADRICYEMIDYMHKKTSIYGNTSFPKYEAFRDFMNFHVLFGRLGSPISVPIIRTPGISERWKDGGTMNNIEERLINDIHDEIHMIVARPNKEIKELNPNDNDDFIKIGSYWNNG
jgi:hypothetical protein